MKNIHEKEMDFLKKAIIGFQSKMRVTILCFFTFFVVSLHANSQDVKVNVNINNQTIKELLSEIEKQTDYLFVYDTNEINVNERVTVNVKNKSLEEVLQSLYSQTNIKSAIEGKNIVLMKTEKALNVQQQTGKTIKGTIVDAQNEPIIGANIREVGNTGNGTITDIDGNFSFNVKDNAVIRITYIGFLDQDINTAGKTTFNIILKEDVKALDEVVVIGYGTRQRKSITGAVDQVGSDVFENRPVSNAMTALQGASANLIIQQKNMNPNDNSLNINIRGVSTMGNNDPLIVIDGLISSSNTLNNINPSDIENVSVLKDAGSAAIYGSRSANGVILVTTKKAKFQISLLLHSVEC